MKNKIKVEINDESILILKGEEEIVGWHVDEWTEDPSIVPSIVNAVNLANTDIKKLEKLLNKIKPKK